MDNEETTTIRVKASTKEKFDKLGSYGMTADEVLNQLIDFHKRYNGLVNR